MSNIKLATASGGSVTLTTANVSGDVVVTLPSANSVLVGEAGLAATAEAISLASASGTWVPNQESATLWFSIVGATNLAKTNYYDIGNIPVIPAISQQTVGVASSASSSTNSMQRSTYAISLSKETSTLRVYVSPVADFQNTDAIYGSVTYLI